MNAHQRPDSTRPETIAFFVNDLHFFRLHRLPIAEAAADLDFDVRVITDYGDHNEPDIRHLRELEFSLSYVPVAKSVTWPWHELRTLIAIRSVLEENPPALLHNVGFKSIVHGTHAAYSLGNEIPVVNHVTGLGHMYAVDGLKERLARSVMNLGFASAFRIVDRQRIVLQNHDDRQLLISEARAPREKTAVILGSGVDTDRYRPRPSPDSGDRPTTVLFAGRLLWTKGVGDFIDAARRLRDDHPGVRWVIVGEPDPENDACVPETQLKEWDGETGIEWWGWRTDMDEVYRSVDVFCLPTVYREGIPKVLMEAAASELAVVTTDVPGCREVVDDGTNGFLVTPGDSRELAERLRRLLADPDLRKRMGRAGRRRIQEGFTKQQVVRETIEVYAELIDLDPTDLTA